MNIGLSLDDNDDAGKDDGDDSECNICGNDYDDDGDNGDDSEGNICDDDDGGGDSKYNICDGEDDGDDVRHGWKYEESNRSQQP